MSEKPSKRYSELLEAEAMEALEQFYNQEYRHGYRLCDVAWSNRTRRFVLTWERTLDSYATDFDWTTPDPKAP